MNNQDIQLIDIKELSQLLSLKDRAIRRNMKSGKIPAPYCKLLGKYRWNKYDIMAWLETLKDNNDNIKHQDI
jgi:predicted DNA-binding transcriptional regulator AlpA